MRTATALAATPATSSWLAPRGDHLPVQEPLPFPGVAPVLPAPVERDDSGPLRHRCARFMQALVEVLSGDRPARQMATWLAPDVYESLSRRLMAHTRAARAPQRRGTARLVSIHVAMVTPEVAEIAARMVHRGRSRAIAVRLEPHTTHRGDQVWRCTALEWA